jgi:hypothetical protein
VLDNMEASNMTLALSFLQASVILKRPCSIDRSMIYPRQAHHPSLASGDEQNSRKAVPTSHLNS